MEKIGRGGMADVYKAFQPRLERYVAIKVLPPALARDETFLERFEREAKAVASLRHPNILTIYDYGEQEGLTYLVMEYVEGGTLKQMLGQPLDVQWTAEIVGRVGGALAYAHRHGVIHRDVKPANVLMQEEDWPLLSDFGLAKMVEQSVQLTKTGVGIGTPEYMSPEQGQGQKIDERTDVYSLGVVLYEMLTGQKPFQADTPIVVVLRHVTAPLPLPRRINPDIPESIELVILKALAKSPDDRFQRMGEMVRALEEAAAEIAGAAREAERRVRAAPLSKLGSGRRLLASLRRSWPCGPATGTPRPVSAQSDGRWRRGSSGRQRLRLCTDRGEKRWRLSGGPKRWEPSSRPWLLCRGTRMPKRFWSKPGPNERGLRRRENDRKELRLLTKKGWSISRLNDGKRRSGLSSEPWPWCQIMKTRRNGSRRPGPRRLSCLQRR
jgi:serine/threonine protein kinase